MLRVLANILLMITFTVFVVINNQYTDVNILLAKLNLSTSMLYLSGVFLGSFFTDLFFVPKVINLNKVIKEQSLKSKNDRNKLVGVYARSGIK